jgi:hypothetical protein
MPMEYIQIAISPLEKMDLQLEDMTLGEQIGIIF